MYVRELDLRDFRSWESLRLTLPPGICLFVGRNGYGKTNIIEAIGYAAHLSSHRVALDGPLIREGAPHARVSVTAVHEGRELTAHLLIKAHGANQAQINRTRLRSAREVLGVIKTVLFSPEDLALVRGEPQVRRNFLDQIIASRTPRLAGIRADYDKVLRQRNALLKSAGGSLRRGYHQASGAEALHTLDIWDEQLAALGAQVIAARMDMVAMLAQHIPQAYASLAPESRPAAVHYRSSAVAGAPNGEQGELNREELVELWQAQLLSELGRYRQRDIDRGTSTVGPHRDDLELYLGSQLAKGYASHGETWSLALAARLAECEILRTPHSDPVLILDDVFAELDARRREKLVAVAQSMEQVLITAAVDADIPANLQPAAQWRIGVSGDPSSRISTIEAEAVGPNHTDADHTDADLTGVDQDAARSDHEGARHD